MHLRKAVEVVFWPPTQIEFKRTIAWTTTCLLLCTLAAIVCLSIDTGAAGYAATLFMPWLIFFVMFGVAVSVIGLKSSDKDGMSYLLP